MAIRENAYITLSGNNVLFEPNAGAGPELIGTRMQGFNLTVMLTTNAATATAVRALTKALTYANVSENPTAAERLLRLTLVDGDGGNDTGTFRGACRCCP